MKTQRRGIVSVSMELLDEWMHLPVGTRVTDIRRREDAPFGEFEVLIEGDAIPETDASESVPHMLCSVTVTEPKVEFTIMPLAARRDKPWKLSDVPAPQSEEDAA